jgi:hypothetical protein
LLYQPFIRKIVTGFLLLLFALSVTPKKLLHDAFANHSDPVAGNSKSISFELNNAGISCQCEDIFAQSLYTFSEHNFEIKPLSLFCNEPKAIVTEFYSSTCFFFELRGPPALLSLS